MPKAKKVVAPKTPLETSEPELDELDDSLEDELDDSLDDELDGDEDLDDDDDAPTFAVEVTAVGKASAMRLIDLLVEKGGLLLATKGKPGPKLVDAIAKILEAPGSLSARATKLSETMVDSEDVEDLFVDDDVLAEILKRW